jgi:hypothetical protein
MEQVVLQRELAGLGFAGGYHQVQRFIKQLRDRRRWVGLATVRFQNERGEQAQVGFSGSARCGFESGPRWYIYMCLPWVFAPPIPTSGWGPAGTTAFQKSAVVF